MIEITKATYPTYRGGKTVTYWRLFHDGQYVDSYPTKEEAERAAEKLRDCERGGS